MMRVKKITGLLAKVLMVSVVWAVIILLISMMTLFSSMQEGLPFDVGDIIVFEFLCIMPWIILTPAVIWLARTYHFEQPHLYKSIRVHLAAAAVLFSLHCLVQSYVVSVQFEIPFTWSYLKRDFLGFIDMRVMLYAGILLSVYSIDFYRKNRKIQLEEPQLKAELNRARFHAILNQIQPDFLLNSIESVKRSLDDDKEEAEEILTGFSDLLRIMLANIEREEVTIREDLESYYLYTALLGRRLGQDIQIEADIEEDCYDDLIPPFLVLMPVIEEVADSLDEHGSLHQITYSARHRNGSVNLEAVVRGEKILSGKIDGLLKRAGVSEVIKRLQLKYGEKVRFVTRGQPDEIRIELMLPFRKAPDSYETAVPIKDRPVKN